MIFQAGSSSCLFVIHQLCYSFNCKSQNFPQVSFFFRAKEILKVLFFLVELLKDSRFLFIFVFIQKCFQSFFLEKLPRNELSCFPRRISGVIFIYSLKIIKEFPTPKTNYVCNDPTFFQNSLKI